MPRILAALLVALIAGVFAMPASARARVHDHADHRTVAATEAVAPAVRSTIAAVSTANPEPATRVAELPATPSCDRDCDHASGMTGFLCMAACIGLALPDLPTLAGPNAAAGPRPVDAAPWPPRALVPPTPPPRA